MEVDGDALGASSAAAAATAAPSSSLWHSSVFPFLQTFWAEQSRPASLGALLTIAFISGWTMLRIASSTCRRSDGYQNLDEERAAALLRAQREAEAEVDEYEAALDVARAEAARAVTEAERARAKAQYDAVAAARREAARAAAAASLERAEKALAFVRREAGKRAAAYRAHMKQSLALPALLEEGVMPGSGHSSIKAKIPNFKCEAQPVRTGGVLTSPGRVRVPPSPCASVRGATPSSGQSPLGKAGGGGAASGGGGWGLGWGSNLFLLPSLYSQPASARPVQTPWQLSKLLAQRAFQWVTPRDTPTAPDTRPPARPLTHSYTSPPARRPISERGGSRSARGRLFGRSPRRGSPSPDGPRGRRSPSRSPSPGPFIPRVRKSAPTEAEKAAKRRRNYNILGDLSLDKGGVDSVPEQIRAALHARKVRVIDLFRQLDDGARAPAPATRRDMEGERAALRAARDAYATHTHAYTRTRLPWSSLVVPSREARCVHTTVRRRQCAVAGSLSFSAASRDCVPTRHPCVYTCASSRADLSGQISAVEFLKAMREFGLQAPADAIAAVFQSFDPDGSNSIEYAELHQLLIRSVQKHPRLAPLKTKAENKVEIRKSPVKKKNSNLLGDLHLAGERKGGVVDDTMPDRIREALHKGYVRVIDLFRQFDDECAPPRAHERPPILAPPLPSPSPRHRAEHSAHLHTPPHMTPPTCTSPPVPLSSPRSSAHAPASAGSARTHARTHTRCPRHPLCASTRTTPCPHVPRTNTPRAHTSPTYTPRGERSRVP